MIILTSSLYVTRNPAVDRMGQTVLVVTDLDFIQVDDLYVI